MCAFWSRYFRVCWNTRFSYSRKRIYYNLEDYDLPEPELLFDLQYFINNPEKYYSFYLVTRMWWY